MTPIRLEKIFHRDNKCIAIFFDYEFYDKQLKAKLHSINAVYSRTKKCWYVLYSKENYLFLLQIFNKVHIKLDNGNIVEKVAGNKSRDHLPIVQKNETIQTKSLENDFENELKTTNSSVHKVSNPVISLAKKLGFKFEYNYGKYWVVKLNYEKTVKEKLLNLKGVYWNNAYKRYMMLRHSDVRSRVHSIFNEVLLPDNFYYKDKQQTNTTSEVKITVYENDQRYMRVLVTGNLFLKNQFKRLTMMRWDKTADCFLFPATPKMIDAMTLLIPEQQTMFINNLPEGYVKRKNEISKSGNQYLKTKDRILDCAPVQAKAMILEMMNCIIAKNYSTHTLRSYTNAFHTLLKHFKYRDPSTLKQKEVIAFLAYISEHCTSSSAINNYVNALKFYFKYVLQWKDTKFEIPRPKKERKLPVVLTENQIINLFQQVNNYKHKLILMLIYGSGLRISEAIDLKWSDLDFEHYQIHVKNAKGRQDRIVMLAHSLVTAIHHYREMYKTTNFVFEGQIAGQPYTAGSIRAVMNRAKLGAGIEQEATVHTLRHCFATHMLDAGTDIRFIQKM